MADVAPSREVFSPRQCHGGLDRTGHTGDGHVQFVKNQLTMNQVQALLSRAGCELINFDY